MYLSRLQDDQTDVLFDAILTLRDREECYRFFEDLCTVSEIKAITQRWEVAQLLRSGMTFADIAEKTGASTATVTRVNRCLKYGAEGYTFMLDRMEKEQAGGK